MATFVCAVIICATSMMGTVTPAGAQSSNDATPQTTLTVSPPLREIAVDAGQTDNSEVRLTNGSTSPTEVRVDIENFVGKGNDGDTVLTKQEGPLSLKNWVSVEPNSASLKVGETKTFKVKIQVPKDGTPGTHLAAVSFSPKTGPSSTQGGSVTIVAKISQLLLVNVNGQAKHDLKLKSFASGDLEKSSQTELASQTASTSPYGGTFRERGFKQSGPIYFQGVFRNDGNVTEKPQATVTISNIFGSKVETLQVESLRVLPGGVERSYRTAWKEKTLFGRYTAKLEWKTPDGATGTKSTTFWVLPTVPIILSIGAILLLIIGVLLIRKAFFSAVAKAVANSDSK